ncbi:MAG: response regulator transcription factor [Nitrospiria bacterium]
MEHTEIPILLVEDSPQDVSIIQRALSKEGIPNPVHVVMDGQEAVDRLRARSDPIGVLILDIHLPKVNGMEVLKVAKAVDAEMVVIMLTHRATMETAVQSLRREGAFDYLEKSKDDLPHLMETIHSAIQKRALSLQNHWTFQGDEGPRVIDMSKVEKGYRLSTRELDVVKCLCQGNSNKEIAEKLFISELTVKVHLKKIYEKMDIHNRATLVSKILTTAVRE